MIRSRILMVTVLAGLLAMPACDYSPQTAADLLSLRAATDALYVDFERPGPPDEKAIQALLDQVDRLLASESARPMNRRLVGQLQSCRRILVMQVQYRRDKGPWPKAWREVQQEEMREAWKRALNIEEARK
jgi:hypothetical protein